MKYMLLCLLFICFAPFLGAQQDLSSAQKLQEIPRNACFQIDAPLPADSTSVHATAAVQAFVASDQDTFPLRIIAQYSDAGIFQTLLRPASWLTPDAVYRVYTHEGIALPECWQANASLADGLVAFRAQPALLPLDTLGDGRWEIWLQLHANAWHWLEIEIVNKWTDTSAKWLEGGQGRDRCIHSGMPPAFFHLRSDPGPEPGDEFEIYITPISIDGERGRRSEAVSVVFPTN